jgi:hypothetical protein
MGHLFVIHGDLTQLFADAVVYSTSRGLDGGGDLFSAFNRNVPGFGAALQALRDARPSLEPGQAFWILPPAKDIPGVVGAASTGGALEKQERCRRVVEQAITVSIQGLRDAGRTGRLLIALPTFLAGQGGGRHDLLELARVQLSVARGLIAFRDDVDVVFVAYTEAVYHAYLAARRALPVMTPSAPPPADPTSVTSSTPAATVPSSPFLDPPPGLVRALRDRECVLFVGSGLSLQAGLHSWGELVQVLQEKLGLDPASGGNHVDYFLDLAQWYREAFPEPSPDSLDKVVARLFGEAGPTLRPTMAHYQLLSLGPPQVITTNYDTLLERTCQALRRPVTRIVEPKDVPKAGRTHATCVVKFHGDAEVPGTAVLSRDDYLHFYQTRPAMALLLEGLLLTRTFFFVGYSLRDPDFQQIYGRISRMLDSAKKTTYATSFDAHGVHAVNQWKRKQLELVPLSGADNDERARTLHIWLDRLVEQVIDVPPVLLAPDRDPDLPESLVGLRQHLLAAGEALEQQCSIPGSLKPTEVAQFLRVLESLVSLGWRPHSHRTLWKLWRDLALQLPDIQERRRMLAHALRHTERLSDADRLIALLDELGPE